TTWTARAIGFAGAIYNISAWQPWDLGENATANITVLRQAVIDTDKNYYVQKELINISGRSYSPSSTVTLWVKNKDTGGTALGFPKSVYTDATGKLNISWNISNYCYGNFTAIGTDEAYPTILNASKDFAVRSWWDPSWKMRKPIYLNNSDASAYSNPIIVNVTGLAGYLGDCKKEIRVVSTVTGQAVQAEVIGGNNNTYCELRFIANISASRTNENNYYVYYNNSQATDPGYSVSPLTAVRKYDYLNYAAEGHTAYYHTNAGTIPPSSGPTVAGETTYSAALYADVDVQDTNLAGTGATKTKRMHRFQFSIAESREKIKGLYIYWFGYTPSPDSVPVNMYIWDYDSSGWTDAGTNSNTASSDVIDETYITTAQSYVSSGQILTFLAETQSYGSGSGTNFYTNYAYVNVTYDITPINRSSVGASQTYFTCIDADYRAPTVKNLTFIPENQTITLPVIISANVTDDNAMGSVLAKITLPNSSVNYLVMQDSEGDSIFNVTFLSTQNIGTYSVTIYANDSVGNLNASVSGSFTVGLEQLLLQTDKSQYVAEESVLLSGKGFSPSSNITLTIYDTTLDPIANYPKNITSNLTGGINATWTIPPGQALGTYIINATDTSDASRSVSKTIEIVSAIITAEYSNYEQGTAVNITGYNWDNYVNVTINVTGPSDELVFGPVNISSNSSGGINNTWFLPYNATIGTYKISGYEPGNPAKFDDYIFSVTARTIALGTEFSWYKAGERVNITGSGFSPGRNISIEIFNLAGNPISGYPKNVTSNSSGG
ncbi:MAG: hypothetical protein ABIJ34_04350, partial [archaeon]